MKRAQALVGELIGSRLVGISLVLIHAWAMNVLNGADNTADISYTEDQYRKLAADREVYEARLKLAAERIVEDGFFAPSHIAIDKSMAERNACLNGAAVVLCLS